VKCSPAKLLESNAPSCYLSGEDFDAIFEAAEALLQGGDADATRLRVDCSELARVETESRNQGLFGPSICYALVRNAESATPKQGDHLLKMVSEAREENRLIICAPGIVWKKALHKKMQAQPDLLQCEFNIPTPAAFGKWLAEELGKHQLNICDEAIQMMGERLHGMRAAARQLIERLKLYDGGEGERIGVEIVGDLLGERSPEDIEAYCHAVALRDTAALGLLRRLVNEQQVSEVQVLSWLGTRMNQLLMYCWYESQRERNSLQKARLFGDARKRVPQESKRWKGSELSHAMKRMVEAEKLIKGASVESKLVVLERMTLDLLKEPGT
jgi:DNA polymerase-3 subunit delta